MLVIKQALTVNTEILLVPGLETAIHEPLGEIARSLVSVPPVDTVWTGVRAHVAGSMLYNPTLFDVPA